MIKIKPIAFTKIEREVLDRCQENCRVCLLDGGCRLQKKLKEHRAKVMKELSKNA